MLRRIKRLAWTHRQQLLSLVILPTFFFATLPHTACICADGHRETFCNVAACRLLAHNSGATVCCGCKCCNSHDGRKCCRNKRGDDESHDLPKTGLFVKSGCCQPIVQFPALVTNLEQVNSVAQSANVAAVDPLPALLPAISTGPALYCIARSIPRPLDAVILFLHLTI